MKKIAVCIIIGLITLNSIAYKTNAYYTVKPFSREDRINVIFENNSTTKGIKKFTLTIIEPTGNKKVEEISMSDDSRRKTLSLIIGSKVYVKNGSLLNTLLGGKSPEKDAPFMTVMLRDKNQTIHLVEEVNVKEIDVLANAAKAAIKLKITDNIKIDYTVSGNIVTVLYKDGNGKILAEFDCDKKNGNVKNINDLRKK